MRIEEIEIIPVRVPAKPGSVDSDEIHDPLHMGAIGGKKGWTVQFDEVPKLIYLVHTDEGITGLGESYRGVAIDEARELANTLIGLDVMRLNLRDLPIPRGRAYDGFEVAIVDLMGKRLGVPAYQLFGGKYRERVLVSAWSGRRTLEDGVRVAREAYEAGFTSIKFKSNLLDDPPALCARIREECGPEFQVLFDPNQRWESPARARRFLVGLEEVGNVLAVEEPFPRWNLEWYRLLRERGSVPVVLHIHLPYVDQGQSVTDAIRAIKLDAVDYFNFGGGMADFQRLSMVADAAGLPYWHGSEVDLGILEASYLHIAAATAHCTLPSDIFGERIREDDLIEEPLRYDGASHFYVPEGPGLGVTIDREALKRYRID